MSLDDDPEPDDAEPPASRRGALVAMAVIAVMVLGAMYLTHVLAGVSRIQDCVMAGRRNCAPITQN